MPDGESKTSKPAAADGRPAARNQKAKAAPEAAPDVMSAGEEVPEIWDVYARSVTMQLCLVVIAFVALIYFLDFSASFSLPLTVAVILGVVLSPVVRALRRIGIPAFVGSALTIFALIGLLYGSVLLFAQPLSNLLTKAPQIAYQLETRFTGLNSAIKAVKKADETVEKATNVGNKADNSVKVVVSKPGPVQRIASSTPELFFQFGLSMVLLYFLLATLSRLRDIAVATRDTFLAKLRTARIFRDVERQCSNYLFTVTCINIGLGALTGTALYLVGFPDAALWGLIVALFNFVPFIGPIVVAGAVALLAVADNPALGDAIVPPLIVLGLHIVESQFVTPAILGRRLTLNPLLVFVSLGFWGWLWGPVGAFISVPLLVIVKAVCDHVDRLATVGALIGYSKEGVRDRFSMGGGGDSRFKNLLVLIAAIPRRVAKKEPGDQRRDDDG